MFKIEGITRDFKQGHSISLPDETSFQLDLSFIESQNMWVVNVVYVPQKFSIYGLVIRNNFNILHSWRRILPFGLACLSQNERDPSFVEDFDVGYSDLILLDKTDKDYYQTFIEA